MLDISAVIATRHRPGPLGRTLASLATQSTQPRELIVVDASDDGETRALCETAGAAIPSVAVRYVRATAAGAAAQRNEGVAQATQPFILFMDDDILLEPDCVARLHHAMDADVRLGGVNAMITNQNYHPPGRASRWLYQLLGAGMLEGESYAGRVLGPALNFLPEDRADLPAVVPVQWLNTTCTLYRCEALPAPPFSAHFTGYSFGEDLALSLRVGQQGWKLANARTARIFHDSQPGAHKDDPADLSRMELVNRFYIMREVLGRRRFTDHLKLGLWEVSRVAAVSMNARSRPKLLPLVRGKLAGWHEILTQREHQNAPHAPVVPK